MRSCEAIYGPQQAEAIEDLVVAATGDVCPCHQGRGCPLLDGEGCNPLAELTPRVDKAAASRRLADAVTAAQRA